MIPSIHIFDENEYSGNLIAQILLNLGYTSSVSQNESELNILSRNNHADILIYNYHTNSENSLKVIKNYKQINIETTILCFVSPGIFFSDLREWNARNNCFDNIVKKPLDKSLVNDAINMSIKNLAYKKPSLKKSENNKTLNFIPTLKQGIFIHIKTDISYKNFNFSEKYEIVKVYSELIDNIQAVCSKYDNEIVRINSSELVLGFFNSGNKYLSFKFLQSIVQNIFLKKPFSHNFIFKTVLIHGIAIKCFVKNIFSPEIDYISPVHNKLNNVINSISPNTIAIESNIITDIKQLSFFKDFKFQKKKIIINEMNFINLFK